MSISTMLPPRQHKDEAEHRRLLAGAIINILRGKLNNTGSVTLTASSATTTLTDIRIGKDAVILFQPTTANAAAELATLYPGTPGDGTVTLNHANNAQTDRTFKYAIFS